MNAAILPKAARGAPRVVLSPGPAPIIATQRLVLRPHKVSDAPAIAETLSDFKVARMLARVPQPYHNQDALDWLMLKTAGILPGWTLAVTTGDDVHIGVVNLEMRHGRWHLAYWLNRMFWEQGYMTELSAPFWNVSSGARRKRSSIRAPLPITSPRSMSSASSASASSMQARLSAGPAMPWSRISIRRLRRQICARRAASSGRSQTQ